MANAEVDDIDSRTTLGRLASSLSHDIRNPLASVKMAIQTIERNRGISERDRRRLAIANREVRTIERMLACLSEYGRESAPHREAMTLQSIIQDAAALVETELSERRISLSLATDSPDIPAVALDRFRMQPVLSQLLVHIASVHPEGSTLQIRIGSDQESVFFQVRDPVSMLRPEDQATLFDPFGSRLAQGGGLTFAALEHVVRSHGGRVFVDTGTPTGVTFTIRFAL